MHPPALHWIDYLIMLIYFAFVLGIGFVLKRSMKTSSDFFLSGRSIPAWVAWLAFIPADWIFHVSIGVSALIFLGYFFLGGLTSAIYNEVLQFFLIVAGLLPLVCLGLYNLGGWDGLAEKVPAGFTHAWIGMESPQTN